MECTSELLTGFARLCERPEARTRAKAREALGIAIIREARIGKENLRTTVAGPWIGEVRASFNQMREEGWIENILPARNRQDYQEFANAISDFYGEFHSDLGYLRERVLRREYPFGDHWLRLTSKGTKRVRNEVYKEEVRKNLPNLFRVTNADAIDKTIKNLKFEKPGEKEWKRLNTAYQSLEMLSELIEDTSKEKEKKLDKLGWWDLRDSMVRQKEDFRVWISNVIKKLEEGQELATPDRKQGVSEDVRFLAGQLEHIIPTSKGERAMLNEWLNGCIDNEEGDK